MKLPVPEQSSPARSPPRRSSLLSSPAPELPCSAPLHQSSLSPRRRCVASPPPLLVPHIVPHGKSRRGEGSLIFFDLLSEGVLLRGQQAGAAPAHRRPPPRMVQDTRPRGRVRLLTVVGPLAPHLPRC